MDIIIAQSFLKYFENDFLGNGIELICPLPEEIEKDMVSGLNVTIISHTLIGKKGEKVDVNFHPGSLGYSSTPGGDPKRYFSAQFHDTDKSLKRVSGEVNFTLSSLTSYDYIKLTTDDAGKKFRLGEVQYEVLEIKDNKVFLKFDGHNERLIYYNLDSNHHLIRAMNYQELSALQKTNPEISTQFQGKSLSVMRKSIYQFFKEYPELRYEDFNQAVGISIIANLKKK